MLGSLFVKAIGPVLGKPSAVVLWITVIIMVIAAIVFAAITVTKLPQQTRHFGYASTFIVFWAATLYFLLASGYGYIVQPGGHVFFYGRYIDWLVTTPLLLLDLALLALPRGFPGRSAVIATLLGADIYMILTGFAASFIRTNYRWAFFAMSCIGFLVVLYTIVMKLTPQAARRGEEARGLYSKLAPMLMGLWICYPIVWALSATGWGVFSLFVTTLLFTILDVAAKVGYGSVLLSRPEALEQAETETVAATGTSRAATQY